VSPLTVTGFPLATLALANTAVSARAAHHQGCRPPATPLSRQSVTVALGVPSYGFGATVTVAVRLAAVIVPVVAAVGASV
jgi:hypothetical protein